MCVDGTRYRGPRARRSEGITIMKKLVIWIGRSAAGYWRKSDRRGAKGPTPFAEAGTVEKIPARAWPKAKLSMERKARPEGEEE
jgi:hypothetical protein